MTIPDDLLRQLQEIFAAEAQDHLQAISRHLLAMEQQPGPAESARLLAEIFREAHSLKGAARAVNMAPVEALAHQLESLFSRLRDAILTPRPDLFDLVYRALDAIGVLVQGAPGAIDVSALCNQLATAAEQPPPVALPAAPERQPPPPPPPYAAKQPADPPLPTGAGAAVDEAPPPNPPTMADDPSASAALDGAQPPPFRTAEPGQRTSEQATVRLATSKLDALMMQVGELQVARIGAEQRLSDARALLEDLNTWDAEWRKLRPQYRRLLLAADGNENHGRAAASALPALQREWAALIAFLDDNETRIREARARLGDLSRTFEADSRRMAQVTADLEDGVRRTRMLPIATVFDAFPRMVRDLARERDKELRLIVYGGETEVDRSILEQIKAPLMHLLRNSADHGIERPAARQAAGKPREGTITLTAAQRGGAIQLEIADDGAGIDLARVRASAVRQGHLTSEAIEAMSDREALWLIFRSGLSTSPSVTDISGRGVGMDVVREHIERMNGMIDVESQPGQGTRFIITLPLTVATTLCLLVRAADQTLALPVTNIVRMLRLGPEQIGRAEGREAIQMNGRPLTLARLADTIELETAAAAQHPLTTMRPAIVLGSAERRIAFLVDALLGAQEIVIKRLPRPLNRIRYTAGAAILGTGEVVMVLNIADLLRAAARATARPIAAPAETARRTDRAGVILVADDSITTRMMEKHILESAGYQVRVAADGMEAWNMLQREGADILVSDVNMPRLDGFGLAEKVRASEQLKRMPIILVTSLDSSADRERGILAGADAYIVKSAFDQDVLLSTIRRLV